jgi:anti-sigma factor RsiW
MMDFMARLACLWVRSRLEPYADGAVAGSTARRIQSHLDGCRACIGRVEELRRLRALVSAAVPEPTPPDFSTFWVGVKGRIAREAPEPVRDPWWLPLWRPVWGHPRLALSGALAAGLALTLSVWPVDDNGSLSSAWAGEVEVQDVSTPDPEHTVMVYSSPDRSLTVIWLFTPDGTPVTQAVSR